MKEDFTMAKYNRNSGKSWSQSEVSQMRKMVNQNTPTRVIGLKLGRTPDDEIDDNDF